MIRLKNILFLFLLFFVTPNFGFAQTGVQIQRMNVAGHAGLDLFQKGQYEKAIEQYEIILTYDPQHPEALKWIGNCKSELGDLEGAISYYQKSIEGAENTSSFEDKGYMIQKHDLLKNVYYNMSLNYVELGNSESAFSGFQNALLQDPENVHLPPSNSDIYVSLGVIRAEFGDFNAAIDFWDKALAIDPHDEVALENKAEALRIKEQQSLQD
ncbi:MAG: tetratricopeptide repeat protein [Rhodospirillales bacterium]|nr:tetratricopeptide repeat protein [Rhodospirillales bacterium]